MPVIIGARTVMEAAIATQASAALPPFSRVLMPVSAASGCSQATAPLDPKTVERPPESGRRAGYLLMPLSYVGPETTFTVYRFLARVSGEFTSRTRFWHGS